MQERSYCIISRSGKKNSCSICLIVIVVSVELGRLKVRPRGTDLQSVTAVSDCHLEGVWPDQSNPVRLNLGLCLKVISAGTVLTFAVY